MDYVRQKDIDKARYPEMIINMAQNNDFIARADVMALLHVNSSQAYTLLRDLVKNDVLEPVNKGKYSKYKIKK